MKNHRTKILASFLGAFTGTGCDNALKRFMEPKDRASDSAPADHPAQPTVAQLVDEAKQILNADPCVETVSDHDCETEEISFQTPSASVNPAADEQNILIADFGMLLPSLTRYKHRVLGHIRLEKNDEFKEYFPKIIFPKTANRILSLFAKDGVYPAREINLDVEFSAKYKHSLENFAGEHGNFSFTVLAEYNPKARFVVAQKPDFFGNEKYLCDKNIAELRNSMARQASSLAKLISQYKIGYVNLSAGSTLDTMRKEWNKHCDPTQLDDNYLQEVLSSEAQIYQVLLNSPGVLSVQAATYGHADDRVSPIDCSHEYTNRIRAGFFSTLESGLNAQGVYLGGDLSQRPQLSPSQASVEKCADIFVNSGVIGKRPFPTNKTPFNAVDKTGLGSFPVTFMAPSWAAPLVLSRAIFQKNTVHAAEPLSNELIAKIKQELTPALCAGWQAGGICKLQDPMLHRQFELAHYEKAIF